MYLIWLPPLFGHLDFDWYMVRCDSENKYQKEMCLKEIPYVLYMLIYDNHSRFHSQHGWGNIYDHLMSTRIFTMRLNKIIM